MGFSTPLFLFGFLPAILLVYFAAPRAWRNAVLFTGSLFFYAWGENFYLLVLLLSLVVNFVMAQRIDDSSYPRRWLIAGIVFNLGLLIGFKYFSFLVQNLAPMWTWLHLKTPQIGSAHLPIGISFFTFQAMAYLIDVYRRELAAQRSFLQFGVYVFLFPHLIAGPIVRYRDIATQLATRHITAEKFASGIRRFIVGLAKKMLLANTLAETADKLFNLPANELGFSAAWLGIICYTLQIYFDFSGYSDMAIGLGRMFGFDFLENFNYPYISTSISDFWRRWHISLSSWFRDYLYIPLGGNRSGPWRTYANLLIVFLLCGLWHGANWTFILWGLFHGVFLILERLGLSKILDHLWLPLRHLYVLIAVMLGWVWFRAESVPEAVAYFECLGGFGRGEYTALDFWNLELALALCIGAVACLPVIPWLRRWKETQCAPGFRFDFVRGAWSVAELGAVNLCFILAVVRLAAETYQPFIYFRF